MSPCSLITWIAVLQTALTYTSGEINVSQYQVCDRRQRVYVHNAVLQCVNSCQRTQHKFIDTALTKAYTVSATCVN